MVEVVVVAEGTAADFAKTAIVAARPAVVTVVAVVVVVVVAVAASAGIAGDEVVGTGVQVVLDIFADS